MKSNANREIEKKYVLLESWKDVESYVLDNGGVIIEELQWSTDHFWAHKNADFLRLRENSMELTLKKSDRGGTFNRIELNVVVDDLDTALQYQTMLHGKAKTLEKLFSVYTYRDCVLSLYSVTGYPETYFEVEGPSEELVDLVSREFENVFNLKREFRSLYQIFFGDENETY